MTKNNKATRIQQLEEQIARYQHAMEAEIGFGTKGYEKAIAILEEMWWELDNLLGITHEVYVSPKCKP